jgi:putative transposase
MEIKMKWVNPKLKLSIRRQCQLLGLNRSSLSYKAKPGSKKNDHIMRLIDQQYMRTPFYGIDRMTDYINELPYGYRVNVKRIRRLYKVMDLQAIGPKPRTTIPGLKQYKHPYLLKDIDVAERNQVWAIDITYIPMFTGHMYLFAIIDLHSRFLLGWSISNTMTTDWCLDCIEAAINKFGKPNVINSDHCLPRFSVGAQFTSKAYTEYLKNKKVKISMDGKGRAIDNIFIERFWRTIKYEYLYIKLPNGGLEL